MIQSDSFGEEQQRCTRLGESLPQVRVLINAQFFIEQTDLFQQLAAMGDSHGYRDVLFHQQMRNLLGRPGTDFAEVLVR